MNTSEQKDTGNDMGMLGEVPEFLELGGALLVAILRNPQTDPTAAATNARLACWHLGELLDMLRTLEKGGKNYFAATIARSAQARRLRKQSQSERLPTNDKAAADRGVDLQPAA